jgi:hypothetical protein
MPDLYDSYEDQRAYDRRPSRVRYDSVQYLQTIVVVRFTALVNPSLQIPLLFALFVYSMYPAELNPCMKPYIWIGLCRKRYTVHAECG